MPEEQKKDYKRKDDRALRVTLVSGSLTLLLVAAGWVYSIGVMSNKVDNNITNIQANKVNIGKILNLFVSSGNKLVRIETLLEGLVETNKTQIVPLLNTVASEQSRRTSEIEESKEHRKNNKIHKH